MFPLVHPFLDRLALLDAIDHVSDGVLLEAIVVSQWHLLKGLIDLVNYVTCLNIKSK